MKKFDTKRAWAVAADYAAGRRRDKGRNASIPYPLKEVQTAFYFGMKHQAQVEAGPVPLSEVVDVLKNWAKKDMSGKQMADFAEEIQARGVKQDA